MSDLKKAEDEAVEIISRLEGWTSAPKREEYYRAGFKAGAAWQREWDVGIALSFLDPVLSDRCCDSTASVIADHIRDQAFDDSAKEKS